MNVSALKNQFLNDLKRSWQKTALLSVLLVVGLSFWIPQLLRAVTKKSGIAKPAAVAAATPAVKTSTTPSQLPTVTVAAQAAPKKTEFSWERGEKLLQTDPLVRSVEVAALRGDPFRMDRDQFPPPILFEDEPVKATAASARVPVVSDTKLAEKLVLKSTIVGRKRRAAFINDKLYYEGREIQVDGQKYLLSAVFPRKVQITQGTTVFELAIKSSFSSEDIDSQPVSETARLP